MKYTILNYLLFKSSSISPLLFVPSHLWLVKWKWSINILFMMNLLEPNAQKQFYKKKNENVGKKPYFINWQQIQNTILYIYNFKQQNFTSPKKITVHVLYAKHIVEFSSASMILSVYRVHSHESYERYKLFLYIVY